MGWDRCIGSMDVLRAARRLKTGALRGGERKLAGKKMVQGKIN